MSRTKGTYTLTSNIEPKVGAPLDARTIVKLLADLTASNTFEYPYKGMKVFVEENNKSYTLVGSDPTVSTNWIEDNSGGHTIKNPAGTAMTQRSNLQFVDLTVSDDSINDVTKVENIHVIQSESELDNLPDGLYMLDEDEGTVIDSDLVGYDNTDSGLEADNVQDAIDEVVEALDDKIDISAKGVANGVAELDSTGKVPSSQLPSFVDDVLEYSSISAFPATGETGKIYVALDTNKTYRWGGTEYVEISESLALGETSSTAYRGDRGKTAYDHSQLTSGNPHNVTKSDIGLGNVDNTSDSTKKTNFTGSIASGNTGFVTGGDVYTALGAKADKVSSATNGNLAGLNGSGNLTDSGWNGAKDTTSISGNPISISGLKSNQLAVNPIITFEPIQDLHGQDKPYPAGGGKNKWSYGNVSGSNTILDKQAIDTITSGSYVISIDSSSTRTTYVSFSFYDESNNTLGSATIQSSQSYMAFSLTGNATKVSVYTPGTVSLVNIQIESGSQPTAYAPYENICPISGYDKIDVLSCGKNIWDGTYDTTIGVGQFLTESNTISPSGGWVVTNYIRVNGNKSYTISGTTSSGNSPAVCWYDENLNYISGSKYANATAKTISLPNNAAFIRFSIYNGVFDSTQLEESTSATSYVPYVKTTSISESLGQTVYGATWYLRTGKFTVTHGIVDLGDLTWTYLTTGSALAPYFYATVNQKYQGVYGTTVYDMICSSFATVKRNSEEFLNNCITADGGQGNAALINVKDTRYTDATAFKTAMVGVKLVYELATPFTIQLTPHEISLLKDYAYLSTNGTSIALDYHNGELASLGDVSQLGETVNKLGKYSNLKDISSEFTINTTSGSGNAQLLYDSKANIVFINAYFNATTSVAYTYVIGTISEKYRPSNTIRLHGGIYINASDAIKFGNFNMYANGSLLNANSSWKSVHIYGWYTVQ